MRPEAGDWTLTAGTQPILLTGASGYVGGRLLKALEDRGLAVRCLARRPEFLRPRVSPTTEVVGGDVLNPDSLREAMKDVQTAYYLVHSMGSREGFRKTDRDAAWKFGQVAQEVGLRRIIYLGGLGSGDGLSEHLESRQEVGRLLAASGVPTVEFRASIIIGSGSLSFEMIRALVEKLPVMVTPRWVRMRAQPIAIEDVVAYLVRALGLKGDENRVFEIGGPDRVSYLEIMMEYARQRGLKRWVIPMPVLTPRLSSLWLGLVTPVYARVGRKLIDGIRNETLVRDESAREMFDVKPRDIREAIRRALVHEDRSFAETRWSDALSSTGESQRWGGVTLGTRMIDSRVVRTAHPPRRAFVPIERIGGDTGWYYGNWLWRLRGMIDLLVGGAGIRRGRRDPEVLVPGDTVDFWRVEAIDPGRLLRLSAEMKLPGRAWLQFEVEGDEHGSSIRQTAIFHPDGLAGLLYWYGLYPVHDLVFRGMLNGIARRAAELGPGHGSAGDKMSAKQTA